MFQVRPLTFRIIVGPLLGSLLSSAACSSTSGPEEESSISEGALAATPVADDDPENDPIAPDPSNPLLVDSVPITTPIDVDYAATAAGAKKFAAATVLAAFRRMRRHYTTVPFKAMQNGPGAVDVKLPNALGISSTVFTALTADGTSPDMDFTTPLDNFKMSWNPTGDGSWGGNLNVMPQSWSDLQAHFFPIAPHRRHGCWTYGIHRTVGAYPACPDPFVKGDIKPVRETVNAVCSGQRPLRADMETDPNCSKWKQALSALPVQMSAYNLMWVDPNGGRPKFVKVPSDIRTSLDMTATTRDSGFKSKAAQWSEAQRAAGFVNVWDYIMLSQVFAFDHAQQQAVLNAYYGDHKKYSGNAATPTFDPTNPTECTTWRAVRPGDPSDGTHCVKGAQVASNGR